MHDVFDKHKKYFFSDHLNRQLTQISNYPLTIIKAPSGFGKTTAIREFLKGNLPHGAREYWYTCLGESLSITWMGICELISNIDEKVAEDLKNLKIPTKDTLNYILSYIKKLRCITETFIVVDNFQLFNCDIIHELLQVFSSHGNLNLHLIFITQQLETRQQFLVNSENIHLIESSSLIFDKKGIASLFHMRGIHLTDNEVEKVFMSTDGWIAAIHLQMISFMRTGSFTLAIDIDQLVEHSIWNHLDFEEKEFLMSVSVLNSFTTDQASTMVCHDILSDNIQKLLRNSDFIKYLPDKDIYSIHSIFHDYLRKRFYHYTSLDYKNSIYRRAGVACTINKQYYKAAKFYYKVRDFDEILSLPFSRKYLEQEKEKYQYRLYAKLINECPDEILCKHPFTMIVFGYMTLMNGYHAEYKKLHKLLTLVTQNESSLCQAKLQQINGEFLLLKSMVEFNDIHSMQKNYLKCWELLGKPSDIVKTSGLVFFGSVSVLNMLWRESGKLDEVLRYMDEGRYLYHKLTRGHGAGTYYAMMAEASLMRGDDNEAEIQCHRALYEARSYKKIDTCLCAELVLARIAILRGDVEGYFSAVNRIKNYPNENSSLYVLRMVEYCMSIISILLNSKDFVSTWFYDMENIKNIVYAPVIPHAQLIYFLLLIMDKRYNEFYGICQYEIDLEKNSTQNVKYMMPQVYRLIFLAVAKRSNGDNLEAQKYLKEALNLALPDQIYLPFAQQECMADFLSELNVNFFKNDNMKDVSPLDKKAKDHIIPLLEETSAKSNLCSRETNSFVALMELCKRQRKGVSVIRKAIHQDRSPLTPREREIALLAKERFSAKEIADMLCISHMTVKATLRSVYSKLDIHSKSELKLKEF